MPKKLLFYIFLSLNLIINLFSYGIAGATEFDELDKPPEGAHEGQMFLGAFFSFGWPYGDYIDAETDFVKDSYYTLDNDVTKSLDVSHQSYVLGISYEYMPIDYIGATIRFNKTYIFQNTAFGSEYQNWKGALYQDYSIYISPTLHATNRKTWDFVLIPLLGYSFGEYHATPVADKILTDSTNGDYSGDMKRNTSGFSYGAVLNCTIYFTGGLYISLGAEWTRKSLNLGKDFNLTNPQTSREYSGKSSGSLDTIGIIFAAGYAFSK